MSQQATKNEEEIDNQKTGTTTQDGGKPNQEQIDDEIRDGANAMFQRMMGESLTKTDENKDDEPKPKDPPEDDPNKLADDEPGKGGEDGGDKKDPEDKDGDDKKGASKPAEVDDGAKKSDSDPDPLLTADIAKAIMEGNKPLVDQLARQNSKPTEPTPEPTQQIPEVVQKNKEIYDKLAQMFPDKHKDLTKKMVEFAIKEEKRISSYEARTGSQYNPDDEEHNEWYNTNMPSIDPEDINEARIQIRVDKAVEKVNRDHSKSIDKIKKEIAEKEFNENVPRIVEEIKDPMAKAFGEEATFNGLEKDNKLAHHILSVAVTNVSPIIEEAARLDRGIVEFDSKNKVHQQVSGVLVALEATVGNMQARDSVRDGKLFATRQKYADMTEAERQSYWTITNQDIRNSIAEHVANEAKTQYDQLKGLMEPEPASKTEPEDGKTDGDDTNAPEFLKQSKSTSSEAAPSVKSRTQINAPKPSGKEEPKSGADLMLKSIFGE